MGKDFFCSFFTNLEHFHLSKTRGKAMIEVDGFPMYRTREDKEMYEKYNWENNPQFFDHYLHTTCFNETGWDGDVMTFPEVKEEILKCMDQGSYQKQIVLTMVLAEMSNETPEGGKEEETIFWYSYC